MGGVGPTCGIRESYAAHTAVATRTTASNLILGLGEGKGIPIRAVAAVVAKSLLPWSKGFQQSRFGFLQMRSICRNRHRNPPFGAVNGQSSTA